MSAPTLHDRHRPLSLAVPLLLAGLAWPGAGCDDAVPQATLPPEAPPVEPAPTAPPCAGETAPAVVVPRGPLAGVPLFGHYALAPSPGDTAQVAQVATQATDEITLEAWVRSDQPADESLLVHNGTPNASGYGLWLRDNRPVLRVGASEVRCVDCELVFGQWTHLAAVRRAGFWLLYRDGQPVTTIGDVNAAPAVPAGWLLIGSDQLGRGALRGAIDEVRIWNAARSAGSIARDHDALLTGDEPGLAAYYRLDEPGGTTAADMSPARRTLTLTGTARRLVSQAGLSTGLGGAAAYTSGGVIDAVLREAPTFEQLTLEAWVRWDGDRRPAALLTIGDTAAAAYGLYIDGGALALRVNGRGALLCDRCRLTPGQWTYVAAVRSAGGWTLYAGDGASATATGLEPLQPARKVTVGGAGPGAEPWYGAVDEVRLWRVARTVEQLTLGARAGLVGSEPGLVAYYRFDERDPLRDAAGGPSLAAHGAVHFVPSGAPLDSAPR